MTVHDDMLYVCVNKTIRCISLKTGKTENILEVNDELNYLDYSERNDAIIVSTVYGLLR